MDDDAAYLRKVVALLAQDIGVRCWNDPDALDRSARCIKDLFAEAGIVPEARGFEYRGNRYENIVAERKGTAEPGRVLIIGAHYDTVMTSPGADDNASGIAGLLLLARQLSRVPTKRTVRFVAFCLEEPPVYRTRSMGSYRYAQALREEGVRVDGMICLEMIGYFSPDKGGQRYPFPLMNRIYPDNGNFIALVGNRRSRRFTERIALDFRKASLLPAVTLNAPAIMIGIDFSDHWSFHQFGYDALMVTDTAFYRNPHYHAPTDLPGTLDYERMTQVVCGLSGAIAAWADDGEERGDRS